MIFDALLNVLFAAVSAVMSALPSFSTPDAGGFTTAVHTFGALASNIRPWFNLTFLMSAVAIVVGARVAVAVGRFSVWVYGLIPGKSA